MFAVKSINTLINCNLGLSVQTRFCRKNKNIIWNVNATLKKLESEDIKLSEKLNNKNFRDKAPKTVIEKFESDHEDLKSKLNKQKSLLKGLEKINNWSLSLLR